MTKSYGWIVAFSNNTLSAYRAHRESLVSPEHLEMIELILSSSAERPSRFNFKVDIPVEDTSPFSREWHTTLEEKLLRMTQSILTHANIELGSPTDPETQKGFNLLVSREVSSGSVSFDGGYTGPVSVRGAKAFLSGVISLTDHSGAEVATSEFRGVSAPEDWFFHSGRKATAPPTHGALCSGASDRDYCKELIKLVAMQAGPEFWLHGLMTTDTKANFGLAKFDLMGLQEAFEITGQEILSKHEYDVIKNTEYVRAEGPRPPYSSNKDYRVSNHETRIPYCDQFFPE